MSPADVLPPPCQWPAAHNCPLTFSRPLGWAALGARAPAQRAALSLERRTFPEPAAYPKTTSSPETSKKPAARAGALTRGSHPEDAVAHSRCSTAQGCPGEWGTKTLILQMSDIEPHCRIGPPLPPTYPHTAQAALPHSPKGSATTGSLRNAYCSRVFWSQPVKAGTPLCFCP